MVYKHTIWEKNGCSCENFYLSNGNIIRVDECVNSNNEKINSPRYFVVGNNREYPDSITLTNLEIGRVSEYSSRNNDPGKQNMGRCNQVAFSWVLAIWPNLDAWLRERQS